MNPSLKYKNHLILIADSANSILNRLKPDESDLTFYELTLKSGNADFMLGKIERAKETYELGRQRSQNTGNNKWLIIFLTRLSFAYKDERNYLKSEELLGRAIEILKIDNNLNPELIIDCYLNYASICHSLKKENKFRKIIKKAESVVIEKFGEGSNHLAKVYSVWADHLDQKKYSAKIKDLRNNALQIYEANLETEEEITYKRYFSLAEQHSLVGNDKQAYKFFELAYELIKKENPEDQISVSDALWNMGAALFHIGEIKRAFDTFKKVFQLDEEIFPEEHQKIAQGMLGIGMTQLGFAEEEYQSNNEIKFEQYLNTANKLVHQSFAVIKTFRNNESNHPEYIEYLFALRHISYLQGDPEKAKIYAKWIDKIKKENKDYKYNPREKRILISLRALALVYAAIGAVDKLKLLLENVYPHTVEIFGSPTHFVPMKIQETITFLDEKLQHQKWGGLYKIVKNSMDEIVKYV